MVVSLLLLLYLFIAGVALCNSSDGVRGAFFDVDEEAKAVLKASLFSSSEPESASLFLFVEDILSIYANEKNIRARMEEVSVLKKDFIYFNDDSLQH